jgi:hypothetical protein
MISILMAIMIILWIYNINQKYDQKYDMYDLQLSAINTQNKSKDLINTTPIIKQFSNIAIDKTTNLKHKILFYPVYDRLKPEYIQTRGIGGGTGGKISENYICPMGTFIDEFKIESDDKNINSLVGICSGKKELIKLGSKSETTKYNKVVKDDRGFNNIYYKADSFVNEISNLEGGDIGRLNLKCPKDQLIVGYRGKSDNKTISHLELICNDKNAELDLPPNYVKCGDDGDICQFNRNSNFIYYGIPGRKVVKIDKRMLNKDSFTCFPQGLFSKKGNPILPIEDPIPGEDKFCYIENKNYYNNGEYDKDIEKLRYRIWSF